MPPGDFLGVAHGCTFQRSTGTGQIPTRGPGGATAALRHRRDRHCSRRSRHRHRHHRRIHHISCRHRQLLWRRPGNGKGTCTVTSAERMPPTDAASLTATSGPTNIIGMAARESQMNKLEFQLERERASGSRFLLRAAEGMKAGLFSSARWEPFRSRDREDNVHTTPPRTLAWR